MIEPLNKFQEKNLRKILKRDFELEIKGQFFKIGKEKVWWFNGKIAKNFLKIILSISKPECLGLYFCTSDGDKVRLSMDASILFGKKIKKGIIELNDEQAKTYLKGESLGIKDKKEGYYTQKNSKDFLGPKIQGNFVVLKNKEDIIGCGKIIKNTLLNYVSKNRRVR